MISQSSILLSDRDRAGSPADSESGFHRPFDTRTKVFLQKNGAREEQVMEPENSLSGTGKTAEIENRGKWTARLSYRT